jgi:hypothetical protein
VSAWAGLSEHEVMRDERLPNWGRWGRQDSNKPDNERGSSSIYLMGRADRQGDGESGDEQDEIVPAMNIPDAEYLDGYIVQLSALHKEIIRCKYYKRRPVQQMDTDAAVRALLDVLAANRAVVDIMRRFGWL